MPLEFDLTSAPSSLEHGRIGYYNKAMYIGDSGGAAHIFGTFPPQNMRFVSPNFPNTGRYHNTLSQASAAASAGELIVVYAGNYNDTGIAKNGVDWYFYPQTNILGSNQDIFQNLNMVGGTYNVYGHGSFNGSTQMVLETRNDNVVYFECLDITNTLSNTIIATYDTSSVVFKCRTINGYPSAVALSSTLTIFCEKIVSTRNTFLGNGTLNLHADLLQVDGDDVIGNGTQNLYCKDIIASDGVFRNPSGQTVYGPCRITNNGASGDGYCINLQYSQGIRLIGDITLIPSGTAQSVFTNAAQTLNVQGTIYAKNALNSLVTVAIGNVVVNSSIV